MLIRCLGMVGVLHPDGETRLTPSQRHIVAILAAAGPDGISYGQFADELWGDDLPAKWEASVRQWIRRMRKSLPIGTIATLNGRYSIDLPSTEVDLWKLLDVELIDLTVEPESTMQQLLAAEPFGGVDLSPLLRVTCETVLAARLGLLERMTTHPRQWSAVTLQSVRELASQSHYRDDVLVAALRLHAAAASPGEALRLGERARTYLDEELDTELSADVTLVLDEIARLPTTGASSAANGQPALGPGRIYGLSDASSLGLIDRSALAEELAAALQHGNVLLEGESGAGKSVVARNVALAQANTGAHVLWLAGHRDAPGAYGAFLAAVPALEEDLAPLLEANVSDITTTQCWSAARRRLVGQSSRQPGERPLLLVLDDAQWLDSHSRPFVSFLAGHRDAVRMLVVGRGAPNSNWITFADSLRRTDFHTVHVPAFTPAELQTLIGLHHPLSSSKQRSDFADALLQRRAALPAVAHELVRSADPHTLAMDLPTMLDQRPEVWVHRVQPETQRIAALGAVLGMRFRVPDLLMLEDLDVDVLLDSLDELLDANLIVSEQRPDEFSFRHVLIHAEFDGILDRGERRRLHVDAGRAAAQRSDVHARATHLVEAGPILDNATVVDAVLASARSLHDEGSHRESAAAFAKARDYSDDQLVANDLFASALSVDRSGGDGWDLRVLAFESAYEAGDMALCLDIAIAGVLITEDAIGDERRIAMFDAIDDRALTTPQRTELAHAHARELGLRGDFDSALEIVAVAMAEAATPDDRMLAWLGAWPVCRALPPSAWPELPADRSAVVKPELVARLAQVECARALLLGQDEACRRQLKTFAEHDFTQKDPLRSWHAALVSATLAMVDGHWDNFTAEADLACERAIGDGIVVAFSVRLGQLYHLEWVCGRHGRLAAALEGAPPDAQQPLLARAGLVVTLAESPDRRAEATQMATELAAEISSRSHYMNAAAAGLLSSIHRDCSTPTIRAQLRSVLAPFEGTPLVGGASIVHLGPTSWSLANLTDDPAERITLLRTACNEADEWNLRLWSVRCRIDLAEATGDESVLEQAAEIAAGTSLEQVMAGHA